MHEVSLMQSALRSAEEHAARAGAGRIHSISLRIGELSGVSAEALRFAFEALALGTAAEGASLKIATVPASFRCRRCGQLHGLAEVPRTCSRCSSEALELVGGSEMELESLEVS